MARKPYSSSRGLPTRVPRELAQEIATTRDGRDITRPFTLELEEYRDQRLRGALDWGAYDKILLDDQVKSTIEQRIRAVVSREWDVLPGDEEDPRSVEAADALKDNLAAIGWDRVTEKKLYAPFYGLSIAELMWGAWTSSSGQKLVGFTDIRVKHGRRFRFDKERRLRLLTTTNHRGEVMPERKFWVTRAGATDDDEPYGRGLAEWLYWPTVFKRNGIRFWNLFLDKFSIPPTKGTYRAGTPREEIDKLLGSMMALANDSGVAIPEGTTIEFMQIATSGIDFEKMPAYMDAAIAKIVLSQTMTTQDGSSLSQAKVHAGVKLEVVKADADLLSDSFNAGPARWWTDLNFGADVASPRVIRLVDEEEDTQAQAETDNTLKSLGWERNEESFRDTYGDGYERAAPPDPIVAVPAGPKPGEDDDQSDEERGNVVPFDRAASFAAQDPAPLHVHRPLKNAAKLIAWAKKAGFMTTLEAKDMHVTVLYSKRAVDWFKLADDWQSGEPLVIPEGGPRRVGRLGEDGAVVLFFGSSRLKWRHDDMVDQGASHDFPDYLPHVTISYDAGEVDLDNTEPYIGPLSFGPEHFEAIEPSWQDGRSALSFAAGVEGDVVDAVAEMLLDQGLQPLEPRVGSLVDAIAAAENAEALDAGLIAALDQANVDQLVEQLARAGFAIRIAAESGEDGPDG